MRAPTSPEPEVNCIAEETVVPEDIDEEEAKEEEKALCSHIRSIQKERSVTEYFLRIVKIQ